MTHPRTLFTRASMSPHLDDHSTAYALERSCESEGAVSNSLTLSRRQNLDAIAGHAEKLNKIMRKTDRVEELVELIAFELWSHDMVEPPLCLLAVWCMRTHVV